jgi:hypothetical protein
MEKAIVLAAAACCCTAASSVCQRMGAKSSPASGFAIGLVFRLARRPVWLLGIACMIAGFVFQLAALRFGALALVQPILAAGPAPLPWRSRGHLLVSRSSPFFLQA